MKASPGQCQFLLRKLKVMSLANDVHIFLSLSLSPAGSFLRSLTSFPTSLTELDGEKLKPPAEVTKRKCTLTNRRERKKKKSQDFFPPSSSEATRFSSPPKYFASYWWRQSRIVFFSFSAHARQKHVFDGL